ncbi:MAG: gst [Sphingomonas bacterium]|nr:gst [Sphingomonas bacterium]
MITCYAFGNVPPFAQGLVRDLRVRWALEETGTPYEVAIVGDGGMPRDAYRALQPFGQVPAIRDGALVLFESGAIVMHIAERGDGLLPPPGDRRAMAVEWMFAALNTVENPIQQLMAVDVFFARESWAKDARPSYLAAVEKRLADLEQALGDRDYLTGEFTAADLLMTTVLRILRHTDVLASYPKLAAYKARCEERPAFQKALADHMADFATPAA